jgi:RHS repeat-associated protein
LTNNNGVNKSRRYTAFGKQRGGSVETGYTYSGQLEDFSGLSYMNARYYDPGIGIFISPDTIIPNPADLMDYNRYTYGRGNPVSNNDPSGHCPEPKGSENTICVDLFIKSDRIALGFGHGDDRDFDTNSDPSQSRAYLFIFLDSEGKVLDQFVHANTSCTEVGCAGPFEGHNKFTALQDPETGKIHVEWDLSNGATSLFQELDPMDYNDPNRSPYWPKPITFGDIASAALPNINGELTLTPVGEGNYTLESLDRDPYPSLEIYQYRYGQEPQTIGTYSQWPGWTPSIPLNPLFPNEVYP